MLIYYILIYKMYIPLQVLGSNAANKALLRGFYTLISQKRKCALSLRIDCQSQWN